MLGLLWIFLGASDPIPVSRLLTRVQKKTSQEEICGWHFMGQELQEYAPLAGTSHSAVPPGITQWAASPRR